MKDLMNLPYSENFSLIPTTTVEEILISDVLNYDLKNDSALSTECDENQLKLFSRTFCQILNTVYKKGKNEFHLNKVLNAGKYYALQFKYSENVPFEKPQEYINLEKYIKKFIDPKWDSIRIRRLLKYYSKDTIILAKPKQIRYWLQSIAIRDADETFADYIKAGF